MKQMLETMGIRLSAGEDLVMVTVTASSGATPRGAGARMLVNARGRLCGTIGGGAVEYRSEQIAKRVLEEKESCGREFTLTREDIQNLGMICGGACNVFFHYIPAGDAATIQLCHQAEEFYRKGEEIWLISDLTRGGTLKLYTPGFFGTSETATASLISKQGRHPRRWQEDGQDLFIEQINAPGRAYIFGGGHVAQELVPVLAHVGFRCVVMDDREEFARRELFPAAEEIIWGDFRKIGDYCTIGSEDYVCIMTRGHASDTEVQAQILKCRPAYCGVIGSRGKAARVRKILQEEYGLTKELLDLVTTPIGLDIRSETPAEIAISIAAQMILRRAERMGR